MTETSKILSTIPRGKYHYFDNKHKNTDDIDIVAYFFCMMPFCIGVFIESFRVGFYIESYFRGIYSDEAELFDGVFKTIAPYLMLTSLFVMLPLYYALPLIPPVRRYLFRRRRASIARYRLAIRESDKMARVILDNITMPEGAEPFVIMLRPFELDGRLKIVPTLEDINLSYGARIPLKECETPSERKSFLEPLDLFDTLSRIAKPSYTNVVSVCDRNNWLYDNIGIIESTDIRWREDVIRLVSKADIVIIMPWTSSGIKWEMGFVASDAIHKAIFIMPPIYRAVTKTTLSKKRLIKHVMPYDLSNAYPFDLSWHKVPVCEWSIINRAWNTATKDLLEVGLHVPEYNYHGALFFYDTFSQLHYSAVPTSPESFAKFMERRSIIIGER